MSKKEKLFFMFLIFMSIARNDGVPIPKILSLFFIVCGALCWSLLMFGSDYTKTERFIQVFLLGIAVVSVIQNHHLGTLLAAMVIVGMKDISLKRALVVIVCILTVVLAFNAVIFMVGILSGNGPSGYYQQRNVMGIFDIEKQYRVYFGILHPNGSQKVVCLISMLILYLNYKFLRLRHVVLLSIVNCAFYMITFSNTGLLLWFLSVLIIYLLKTHEEWEKCVGKMIPPVYILMLAVVLYCTFFYSESSIIAILNRWLTGRLSLANQYIRAMGMSIWGQNVSSALGGLDLDCAYVNLLLSYGCIVFFSYCAGVFGLLICLYHKRKYLDMVLLMLLHCFFVLESFIMVVYMNWTFIYMGMCLYESLSPKRIVGKD